jgi:ArsR family transcriptional regulator, arsenate/arsenite/antimonite-responsive transcriptional repressor
MVEGGGILLLTRGRQYSIVRSMSNNPNYEMERFADMFKALSNPHRLHIFLRLISCCPPGTKCAWDAEGKRYVGQLAQEVSVAPSTVSHHIKELRNARLIKVARQGKNMECWVDPDAVRSLAELLSGRFPDGLLRDGSPGQTRDRGCPATEPDPGGAPCCLHVADAIEPET